VITFTPQQEKRIREYFRISIFLKGVMSLIEVIGGILAFFVPVSSVTNFIVHLAQGELIEEPGDFIATHLIAIAQQFSVASGTFIAIYLLSRGLIKLFLVVALLKNQLWAYPSSLVVLGLFVVYQLYQIVTTFSILLVALTIFDLIVMWFIWREYEVVRLRVVQ
jgi:uncharacterized membrane protein